MKTGGKDEIALYAADAQEARARIGAIIDRVQLRLSPERLIQDATEAAKGQAAEQIEETRKALQRHPVAVGLVVGLIGLFAARRLTRNE